MTQNPPSKSRRPAVRRLITTVVAVAVGFLVADRMMTSRSIADDHAHAAGDAHGAATAPAATRPTIPADAQAIFDRVTAAYANRPVEIVGTLEQHFDVAGVVRDQKLALRGLTRDAKTFRHEAGEALLIVGDGKAMHLYDPRGNRFRTQTIDAATTPAELLAILTIQNPALGVSLSGDAARAIVPDGAGNVRLLEPATDAGVSFDRVAFDADGVGTQVWVRTGEGGGAIDRVVYDFVPLLQRDGAAAIKRAEAVIRYQTPRPAAGEANADALFAFAPPPGARDVAAGGGDEEGPHASENRPGPAFALKDLDGNETRLADLKGSVVVLDFWATWCGPCRVSLPHLSATARKYADRGVKVFAINREEDPDTVRQFLNASPIAGVKTLLDADGRVSAAYGVNGIPHTVVLDKSGTVRKVIIGFNPNTGDADLSAAIDAASAR